MIIIHFVHNINFLGGAHIHILELSKNQKLLGCNVKIISYNIDNLKEYGFGKKYKKEGVEILEFNCKDTIKFMGIPKHTKQEDIIITNYFKKENINIIHLHVWYSPLSISIAKIAKKLGIKVFLTEHTYYTICPDNWFFQNGKGCNINNIKNDCINCEIYEKISSNVGISKEKLFKYRKKENILIIENYINKIICPSKTLYNDLNTYGINKDKLKFIRHGINKTNTFKVKNNNEKITFGFIGRLSKVKGFNVLNKILNNLSYKYNNFNLLVVGSTENSDINIGNNKYETNFIENLDKKYIYTKFYSNIDFLIVPSLWKETGPINILEAFNVKVPVIGNNIGGIGELLLNGENGLLYNNQLELENVLINILEGKKIINNKGFKVKSLNDYTNTIINLYKND